MAAFVIMSTVVRFSFLAHGCASVLLQPIISRLVAPHRTRSGEQSPPNILLFLCRAVNYGETDHRSLFRSFGMLAQEKRTQFQQKGRSMNSTGSGKSNATVSSVSELLDLYEEDPEEILYNLGFGTEEPDIASKIPSRFFNTASSAKGIDIKVYLGAQLQRLELESPNYALTSRFRQIEVLTTVANAFSSLYSQVSGTPVQRIGSCDAEPKEVPLLKRNNSALNIAKKFKKTVTERCLLGGADKGSASLEEERERVSDEHGHKQTPKCKKDQPALATVAETEESQKPSADPPPSSSSSDPPNGDRVTPEEPDLAPAKDPSLSAEADAEPPKEQTVTSTPEKEPPTHRLHPCISHLLSQTKDSFEMEEVQSNEGEGLPGTSSTSRDGNELLLRTASQHSDSSGFAEDPSADASANSLKVQESSDSCDSETTVTSNVGEQNTPLTQDHHVLHKTPEEKKGVSDTTQNGAGTLDQPTEQEPLPGGEAQTAAVTDSTEVLNMAAESRNPRNDEPSKEEEEEEVEFPQYTPHQIPHPAPKEMCAHEHGEPSSNEVPGSPAEPGDHAEVSPALGPGSGVTGDSGSGPALSQSRVTRTWVKPHDLQRGRGKYPLRRSRSLPTSLLSPSRVVSSVKIQLRSGSPRHCTPTSFSYRYTPEEEEEDAVRSIVEEEEEEEEQLSCRSTLIIKRPLQERDAPDPLRGAEDVPPSRMPPYPLHLPRHLTQSSCSLHSAPPDWPERGLCEQSRSWSTCSMPALPPHSAPYGSPGPHPNSAPYSSAFSHPNSSPYSSAFSHPNSAHYSSAFSHPNSSPYSSAFSHQNSASYSSAFSHPNSAPYSSVFGQPNNAPFTPPFGHPNSAPYSSTFSHPSSAPFTPPLGHPNNAPFTPPFSHPNSAPNSSSYGHPYSAPYGQPHSGPYLYGVPQSNCSPYNAPYGTPLSLPNHYSSNPHIFSPVPAPQRPLQPPSGVEMQLRRVLHDVRGAVRNLAQSTSLHDTDMATPMFSMDGQRRSTETLYEENVQELQGIRSNLSMFRTQMMDLELALMRQQDKVYKHLTEEDRQETEHLKSLRNAVRQELQELELQLEDRLLFLEEHLRTAHYRHPVGIHRGHSMDSLCSTPPMNVVEPGRGRASATPSLASGRSSGTASPARPGCPSGTPGPDCPSPQRTGPGVYRSTICLTPAPPSRQQAPPPAQTTPTPVRTDATPASDRPEDTVGGGAESPHPQGDVTEEGGAGGPHLQQLIKEIKRSIADEIRQEIVKRRLPVE
ncbi:hypothetical protein JZ751_020187 [Albula glossodonta]|uniref:ITPR-interacting domain-containing protein n=1 Tax=Albula glossodonta TaxID=121402 RepID=A0A8T2NTR6_9TELE|nr:hypothetical protein JZ751_020187 [Albula glossodonta]